MDSRYGWRLCTCEKHKLQLLPESFIDKDRSFHSGDECKPPPENLWNLRCNNENHTIFRGSLTGATEYARFNWVCDQCDEPEEYDMYIQDDLVTTQYSLDEAGNRDALPI